MSAAEIKSLFFVFVTLVTFDTSATGFLDAYFYMIPPQGTISIFDSLENDTLVTSIVDQPSVVEFTTQIPTEIEGFVQLSNPVNACKDVDPPPGFPANFHKRFDLDLASSGEVKGQSPWILLASKLDCPYKTKIEHADAAGYSALVIFNVGSNDTEVIGLTEEQAGRPIKIVVPSFFVGDYGGSELKHIFTQNDNNRYFARINTNPPTYKDVVFYFLWTVLAFFFLLFVLCIAKPIYECGFQQWVERHRRDRRKTLLTRAVSSLAIVEWKDDLVEKFETCVICMEEYGDAELLKILPCNHGFHTNCIDFWLLKIRRVCPICKQKVTYSCWEDSSDSDISDGNYFTDIAYEPFPTTGNRNRESDFRRQFVDLEPNGEETGSMTSDLSSIDSIGVPSVQFDLDCPPPSTSYLSTTASVHDFAEGQRSMTSDDTTTSTTAQKSFDDINSFS